jgi:hypothetical protein
MIDPEVGAFWVFESGASHSTLQDPISTSKVLIFRCLAALVPFIGHSLRFSYSSPFGFKIFG